MTELVCWNVSNRELRRSFFGTASIAVLAAVCATAPTSAAQTAERPQVWIELGAQLDDGAGGQALLAPAFVLADPNSPPFDSASPISAQQFSRVSVGGQGKVTLAPENSEWLFSAGVRYGRSNGKKHPHQQTIIPATNPVATQLPIFKIERFSDTATEYEESHYILDFMVGRDVGFGLAGSGGQSTINFGLRIAQFNSASRVHITARPDLSIHRLGYKYTYEYHQFHATGFATRNVQAIGPSISWDASAPVVDISGGSSIEVDWGINASVLFGRQRADVHRGTAGSYQTNYVGYNQNIISSYQTAANSRRSTRVIIPNVGGFAGISLRLPNAKVIFGYRGDFFFGAMDGGIDIRTTYNRNFYGPFATISIGFGG